MSVPLRRVLSHVADVLIAAASPHRVLFAAAAVAAGVLACRDTTTPQAKAVNIDPSSTMGVGFTSTLIGRGNLGSFNIKCNDDNSDNKSGGDGYCAELKSRDNTDIAVLNIGITPGGTSGWHYHPGPVLVVVKSGTITFYSADDRNCAPKVHPAGTSFYERGGIVGNARNEGTVDVVGVATFFAPPGSALRFDAAAPENCAK